MKEITQDEYKANGVIETSSRANNSLASALVQSTPSESLPPSLQSIIREGCGEGTTPLDDADLDVDPWDDQLGILPIAKSTLEEQAPHWLGWTLPGHGRAYTSNDQGGECGSFGRKDGPYKGCLRVDQHGEPRLDGSSYKGKIYVKAYARNCYRRECPIDYHSWASREGFRATRRIKYWKVRRAKPIHVIVSPSREDILKLSYRGLRSKAYEILRSVGVYGGLCIVHPFRHTAKGKAWEISPHFHIVGYGWVSHVGDMHEETGWIVKNKGVRKSVPWTIAYQLSHAGVKEKLHTITWFGNLSYNKLKIIKEREEYEETCPLCGEPLERIVHAGKDPPMEIKGVGEYFLEPTNWEPMHAGYSPYRS